MAFTFLTTRKFKRQEKLLLSGVINKAIAFKNYQFSETQDFTQLSIDLLIGETIFTVSITNMTQRLAGRVVVIELKMPKQFGGQSSSGGEDNTPPSPMSGKSLKSRKPLIVKEKPGVGDESRKELEGDKNAKKADGNTKNSHSSGSRTSCRRNGVDESDKS